MSQALTRRMAAPREWTDPRKHFGVAARSPWYRMLTHLYSTLIESTVDFYRAENVSPVLMPVTVSSVSSPMGLGSDSLPVRIELFDEPTYLADSMQFQLEFMLRHGLRGAYYIMPTFRGEDPDSTHLNQFFHSEAEILGGLQDVMSLVERYVSALAAGLLAGPVAGDIAEAAGTAAHLQALAGARELPRITFDQAHDLLGGPAFVLKAPGAPAITRAGETALIGHFRGPVWLTRPPTLAVPFYQRGDDRGRADCADLLLGVGEVVGCGARHVTGDEVRRSLLAHRVDEREYAWYVRMKDDEPLATAGFGLGIERYVMWALGHDDIRDLHVMPRLKGHATWL